MAEIYSITQARRLDVQQKVRERFCSCGDYEEHVLKHHIFMKPGAMIYFLVLNRPETGRHCIIGRWCVSTMIFRASVRGYRS